MTTDITLNKPTSCLCRLLPVVTLCANALADDALFQSRQVTPAGEYTFGIEGPAVDAAGNLYVVNFQKAGTIGILKPNARASELFATLPEGGSGVSIRFGRDGRMFIRGKEPVFCIGKK